MFYTAVSQWLGFPKYGDEGKVMGLAPFGNPRFLDQMRTLVRMQHDGTFELDAAAFAHHNGGASMTWDDGEPVLGALFGPRFNQLFGEPRQPSRDGWSDLNNPETRRFVDVAASLQVKLVEAEV